MLATLSIVRFLRHRAGWLLAIGLLLFWPFAQNVLSAYQQLSTGDKQAAAAQSVWLPLGNPLSKIMLTLAVAALGYAFMWGAMRLFHSCLHSWAKTDFKTAFISLTPKWQLALFTAFWLGLLFFFALCWLGASLVA
jgi:hypothetical protein